MIIVVLSKVVCLFGLNQKADRQRPNSRCLTVVGVRNTKEEKDPKSVFGTVVGFFANGKCR